MLKTRYRQSKRLITINAICKIGITLIPAVNLILTHPYVIFIDIFQSFKHRYRHVLVIKQLIFAISCSSHGSTITYDCYTAKGTTFVKTALECFYFVHKGIDDGRGFGMQSPNTLAHGRCAAYDW